MNRVDARKKMAPNCCTNKTNVALGCIGDHGLRTWKVKTGTGSYLTHHPRSKSRVMELGWKAIYRSWAHSPCTGKQVYAPRHRAEWAREDQRKPGVRRREEFFTSSYDALRTLPPGKCGAGYAGGEQEHTKLENGLCGLSPRSVRIRARGGCWASYRPRTGSAPKRQLLGLMAVSVSKRSSSARYTVLLTGQLRHGKKEKADGRFRGGLNRNYNHDLKKYFSREAGHSSPLFFLD